MTVISALREILQGSGLTKRTLLRNEIFLEQSTTLNYIRLNSLLEQSRSLEDSISCFGSYSTTTLPESLSDDKTCLKQFIVPFCVKLQSVENMVTLCSIIA